MCRLRLALLTPLVLWSGSVAAQEPAAVLQRMEERLDSMQQARALRDSLAFRAAYGDTVVAGGLRIATSPRLRPLALAAGEEAWQSLVTRFGPSVAVQGAFPVTTFGSSRSTVPKRVTVRRVRELARGFERGGAQWIWQTQGAAVLGWLRGSVPTGTISPADAEDLAAELLRTPARTNRACFAGGAQACASTLGVRVGADTLDEWFERSTWPRLAGMVYGELNGLERVARQHCMDGGDLSACRSILTPARVLPPVGVIGRQYLLQLALESGGASAFERLNADTGATIEQRLAGAAGVPIDTLLERWSAGLRAVPRGPAAPPQELLLGLVWSGLLLAVALRGSRWR
jgi:hypothetical protein